MTQFILTAKQNIIRPNGFNLPKGHQMIITIPMLGIQPGNLFGNNRCKEALLNQFRLQGINIPPTDTGFYSRANWDVKMK